MRLKVVVALVIACLFLMPEPSQAMTNGLLDQKLPDEITGTVTNPLNITDSSNVSYATFTSGHAKYILDRPMDITHVYYTTSPPGSVVARFYNSDDVLVGSFQTPSDSKWQVKSVLNVKYIVLSGTGRLMSFDIRGTVRNPTPPDEVENLVGTALSHSSVRLSYTLPPNAQSVRIYRNNVLINDVSTNQYTDTDLQPGTEYTYTLKTVSPEGDTSEGRSVKVKTLPPPPLPEISVTVQDVASKKVVLSIATEHTDTLKVYRDGQLIATLPGTATNYTDTKVNASTEYIYWIVAENTEGTTESERITVKTLDIPLPTAAVSVSKATDKQVSLKLDTTDADTIKVYRDGQLIATLPGTATNYTDTKVVANKEYEYWIMAENEAGTAESERINVKAETAGQVTNLRTLEKKKDSIKFGWDENATAEKYRVEIIVTHNQTASIMPLANPPQTRTVVDIQSNYISVEDLAVGDVVEISVSLYNAAYGVHGTAKLREVVPAFDIPGFETGATFTPSDLFRSAVSLASNFWAFLLLSLAFLVAPWIFAITTKATTAPKNEREMKRHIRMSVRGKYSQ